MRYLWAALCCLLLSACATPQADSLQQAAHPIRQQRVQLDVPFVAQTDDSCGPASLSMVLRDMGRPGDPVQLSLQTLLPGRGGSLQAEMLATARRQQLLAYRVDPQLVNLIRELEQGRPVIALVNLSLKWWPRWHYVVLNGYDLQRGSFTVHSGKHANEVWSAQLFERLWSRAGQWAFVMLEPGQWPAVVDEARYIQAALDLEHTASLTAAGSAYAAAAQRWPDNLTALVGAGNAAYARRDLRAALPLYRHAATVHATSATAANNLAQVLFELGQRTEAAHWARIAVDRGGGAAARQTLEEIGRSLAGAD